MNDENRKHPRLKSISTRLTVFALALSILPAILISSQLIMQMERITERELTRSYQWLVSEHMGNVSEKLEQYANSLSYTSQNTTILNALEDESGDPYQLGRIVSAEVYKSISMQNRKEVRNCMIYSTGKVKAYGDCATQLTKNVEKQWNSVGWNGGADCFIETTWDNRRMLSFVQPLVQVNTTNLSNRRLGMIRLDLYLDELFAPYVESLANAGQYQLALFDRQGECVYASIEGMEALPDNYSTIRRELPDYGLTLVYLFDENELAAQKQTVKRMVYPTLIVLMLIIVVSAAVFFTGFSRRVNGLVKKFRIAATGDLAPRPPLGGDDEIAMLDRQFDRMLVEMNEMNQRSASQKNTIREARYRNLQLQINPHFLYNTLETISAIGALHGVFQVCDLCEKLGSLFRYSLGKNEGRFTPLERELQQTQNYIFIQQVRYKFEVFYSIDVDAADVFVPRFLLQPILENAIQHGLDGRESLGTLEVQASRDGDDLVISIRDDGVGMTPETLENLRALISAEIDGRRDISKIGVWNIHQRIRLTFGPPYGVEVDSWPGHGSAFCLRMPYITGEMIENDELQAADRG